MKKSRNSTPSVKKILALVMTTVLLVTLCSPMQTSSAAEPVISGGPIPVDGRILPMDKAGDTSAWIEIAQYGNYSLILRQTPLTNSLTTYSASVSNNTYADSIARKEVNNWYKNKLSSSSRLRSFAVMNNVMAHLGSYGTFFVDGISQPILTSQEPKGDDIAFLLSFCEAAFYCSTQYHLDWGVTTLKSSSKEAYNNYYKLLPRDAGIDISPAYWLRSPSKVYYAAGCVAYQGGQPYDLTNGRVMSHTVIGTYGHYRPALWVDSDIFEPDKATIKVINYDITDDTILSEYSEPVDAGSYGPYTPEIIAGYEYVGLGTGSAPTTGTIATKDTITIIFNYKKDLFDITYDPNGGSGSIETDAIAGGSSYIIKDQGYAKADSDFAGYNTERDGSGSSYSVGQTITVTDNLTLYAQWEEALYEIAYYYDWSMPPLIETFAPGMSYTILGSMSDPAPGYKFNNWNTAPSGSGLTYFPGQTITITGDLTLYAMWSPASSIIYDSNGAGLSSITDFGTGGVFTIKGEQFTRDGFKFKGWGLSPYDGFILPEGLVIGGLSGMLTVYAQWELDDSPAGFSITYNANTGIGDPVKEYADATTGQITVTATNPFSKPGWLFVGWNTRDDGFGVSYYPGVPITLSSSLTLYAQWVELLLPD